MASSNIPNVTIGDVAYSLADDGLASPVYDVVLSDSDSDSDDDDSDDSDCSDTDSDSDDDDDPDSDGHETRAWVNARFLLAMAMLVGAGPVSAALLMALVRL